MPHSAPLLNPGGVTVGIVSPGAMGAAVGRAFARGGARAVATTAGRGPRTRTLADTAGLDLLPDLDAVVEASDLVFSVVPPAAAVAVAAAVAASARRTGASPLVVDANAVSPDTMTAVVEALAGLETVDASISGQPPGGPGAPTRLYLAGAAASIIAALPAPGLQSIVLADQPGKASALKMCTSAYYKGTALLLAQSLLTADVYGLAEHVVEDFGAELGSLRDPGRSLTLTASKSARYGGEMLEIAATQASAGLDRKLFEAFAELCDYLAGSAAGRTAPEDVQSVPGLLDALAALRERAR